MSLKGEPTSPALRTAVAAVAASVLLRRPRIAVLGDVMLDEYFSGSVDRISPEAPIPVVACKSVKASPGGAANVAANLARLGAAASIIAVVGEDETAVRLKVSLLAGTVNADHLVAVAGRPTTRKLRIVSGGQQIVRVDFEEAGPLGAAAGRLIDAIRGALQDCDALVISDYNKGVCQPDVLRLAIDTARARGIPVLCDPKGRSYEKYSGASIITPNRREAAEATNHDLGDDGAVATAAHQLRETLKLDACLITLGPDGMLLAGKDETRKVGAFTQEVADVTGAGDSVIAALAVALTARQSYWEAALFANSVAAIAVSRHGSVAVALEEVVATYAASPAQPTSSKILSRKEAAERVANLRREGRSVTFTNGCFDILHAGHVENLEHCASLGSFLVVGLNDDASVRRLKGSSRPVNDQNARARVLAALGVVDCVVLFDEDTPDELIREIRPDVLVKGADYQGKFVAGQDFVESYGGRVEFVGLKPGYSTTNVIRKLQDSMS